MYKILMVGIAISATPLVSMQGNSVSTKKPEISARIAVSYEECVERCPEQQVMIMHFGGTYLYESPERIACKSECKRNAYFK